MPLPSPSTDPHIVRHYAAGTLDQKLQNKTALQRELGWPAEPKRPMLCLPAGMTEALGGKLLEEVLPGLLSLQAEVLVLGKGSADYGALFTRLSKDQAHRFHIVSEDDKAIHRMYAASDMALFLSPAIPTQELNMCLAFGTVPVSFPHELLEDYNPVQETGNAFVFTHATTWHCFAALVRAIETYKFPFDWRTIQKHCMETAKSLN